jgi:hypothetical protein
MLKQSEKTMPGDTGMVHAKKMTHGQAGTAWWPIKHLRRL